MAQSITAVNSPGIEHGVLIDLTLPDQLTGAPILYRISNCYTNVIHNGNTYLALGGFLQITDIQGDLQSTNNEITLALSAIEPDYIEAILQQEIKGGALKIYRVFFDTVTQQVITGQVFLRFDGVINNYAIQEDVNNTGNFLPEITHTITITASSIQGVLEGRTSGRRTNQQSYQKFYPEQFITNAIAVDPLMNRVVTLRAASFDFGRPIQ
jgi:hypothetical protein